MIKTVYSQIYRKITMFLIFILYFLMASTFALGKSALMYSSVCMLIGVRMIIGGGILLAFQAYRGLLHIKREHWLLLAAVSAVHIYISFLTEFWSLQYITAAKVSLLFNLSPFVSAIIGYFFINERLTLKQWLALLIGFVGFAPILWAQAPAEMVAGEVGFLSWPECVLLISVISGSLGWILIKQLVDDGYSPLSVNGYAMFFAGWAALCTAPFWGGTKIAARGFDTTTQWLYQYAGKYTDFLSFGWYVLLLIIIANVICYPLYAYLLKKYSATFMAFAGCIICPFFAALLDWAWLGEKVTWHYWVSLIIVTYALYLFHADEKSSITTEN